jgi:hypothetical protein
MKRIVILSAAVAAFALNSFGWGQKGHDVTAYIAEQHLTEKTRAAIDSIFEHKSIVYWANWLDNASHTADYAYSKTWHYKNIDEGVRYEEAPANPAGDAVVAIRQQIETLSDKDADMSARQLALKMLVHIVGDLHQPMHMGHATDLGGNRVKVKYFGQDTDLHTIWDTNLVESAHRWSFTEWQQQLDRLSANEEAAIVSGTIDDWAKETFALATHVYNTTPEGSKIFYDQVATATPIIEQQLLKGGLRLAHLLNTLFDIK